MAAPLILIVDDDESITFSLRIFFEDKGYGVMTADTGREGLAIALKEAPDTVLLDLRLPDMHGFEILTEIKKNYPEISTVMMTAYGDIGEAVKAMKLGAEYFFQKPVDLNELSVIVEKSLGLKEMRQSSTLCRLAPEEYPIVGRSKHVQSLIHLISLLAANPSTTVLIQGETGTGKELAAMNIHARSIRRRRPFVELNCAAIPEQIVESELFGYEAGAFTDAKKTKRGLIELADGGTLFLDEIGDMPLGTQAKLLRVLEGRTIKRLGGTRDITVDIRIIAATNRDLALLAGKGAFREDLFYRLNVMPLDILPLRERPEDIPLIAEFLLNELITAQGKKEIGGIDSKALDLLSSYSWPGNVRELRNVIERAVILCRQGPITSEHVILPRERVNHVHAAPSVSLDDAEKAHIERVLGLAGGNRSKAARMLGIARSTLNEKIKQYSLS